MIFRRLAPLLLWILSVPSCRTNPEPSQTLATLRDVHLPNGFRVRAEVMVRPEDMARGMMFRDSLPADRGMLFIHPRPGRYPYWMHNVRIPLDIIWLDGGKQIVSMSENTPPCGGPPESCPTYGGTVDAMYVLELAGGSAARHGLKTGDRLRF